PVVDFMGPVAGAVEEQPVKAIRVDLANEGVQPDNEFLTRSQVVKTQLVPTCIDPRAQGPDEPILLLDGKNLIKGRGRLDNGTLRAFGHHVLRAAEPMAEADQGRHLGFTRFNVIAGGPGSFAERSAWSSATGRLDPVVPVVVGRRN